MWRLLGDPGIAGVVPGHAKNLPVERGSLQRHSGCTANLQESGWSLQGKLERGDLAREKWGKRELPTEPECHRPTKGLPALRLNIDRKILNTEEKSDAK